MRANIVATKANFLKTKRTLALTEEGHALLDEKRKLLINELTAIIHIVNRFQKDVDTALAKAYSLFDKAIVVMGRRKLEELSYAIEVKTDISIFQNRVMGVNMPQIELNIVEKTPYFSPTGVSVHVDEAISGFKELPKLLAQLAEKKIALLRIAREVQKTVRKVNALEKIHLPFYRETLKYIGERLDEESRDAFSMLKNIKQKLASSGQAR